MNDEAKPARRVGRRRRSPEALDALRVRQRRDERVLKEQHASQRRELREAEIDRRETRHRVGRRRRRDDRLPDRSLSSLAEGLEKLPRGSDLAALDLVYRMQLMLEQATVLHITRARQEGASWESIATAMGMTRQAAHERFADAVRSRESG